MLIAVPYLLGAWLLTVWIADGGPGWLNLLVLLFIWNALKFLVNGPITMIVLIRARVAERRDRRLAERESTGYAISEDAPLLTSSRA